MPTIEITFDLDALVSYTDTHLAALWHVGQANPASIENPEAGRIAERIGREIIRRWLERTGPELWVHQGAHAPWCELQELRNSQGQQ